MRYRLRGLTLAEVLLSSAILTVVLLLLIGVFISGLKLMQRSETLTAASTIGREFLETVEDIGGYSALPTTDSVFNGANPDDPVNEFPPSPYPTTIREGREYSLRVETKRDGDITAILVTVTGDEGRAQLEKVYHEAETVR